MCLNKGVEFMKQNNKKRFLSALLILSMLCSIVLNGSPARAAEEESSSNSNAITLDNAPEKDFASWTFSDANFNYTQFGHTWTTAESDKQTTGNTLDMSIFRGKIKFPTVESEFVIGERDTSLYRGLRFFNTGSKLSLVFTTSAGDVALGTFDPEIAGTTLIDNKDLEVAVSFEYTSETDTTATMKVGVFFNGKLYNNTYFTVTDAPKEYLKQTIRFRNVNTSVKWNVESIVTLHSAPENTFAHWTFSDANFNYTQFGHTWTTTESDKQTTGRNLNKTLFQGKIKFPTVESEFIIGERDTSLYRGFRFFNNGKKITLAFSGSNGIYYDKDGATGKELVTFDPMIAGTTLIDNKNLEVAVSVEYTSETDTTATMKVGVFFNGRLYNNTYFTVTDAPKEYLKQTIRFRNVDTSVKWNVESIKITLGTAPENKFDNWTFMDTNIPDGPFGYRWTESNHTTGEALNKTLFQGKIKFPNVTASEFVIGEHVESGYNGFRFRQESGKDTLSFLFRGESETAIELATFAPTIARTTLIENENLEVAVSVEYIRIKDGLVTMKVGVFFDERLYNDTYIIVKDVPEKYLTQTIRFKNDYYSTDKWNVKSIVTLDSALENKFAHWTFSDVNIPDGEFGHRWNANEHTTGKILNKTLFQGKIKFPTVQSEFIIGENVASNYNGFRFFNNGSTLSLLFRGESETATTLATFDKDIARTTLINNENLDVAVSFEYTSETDTTATVKVGVFFDGKLYNNTYITVEDVPKQYLTQTIRFQNSDTNVKWNVESNKITLDKAPERKFAHWTLSDVNIPDGTFGERWTDSEVVLHTTEKTLNKTLFQGKMKFPTVDDAHSAEFVIGKKVGESKYEGFRFRSSDGKLNLLFTTKDGAKTDTLATFDPTIAKTTLIGNEDLEIAFSVEYTKIEDGLVTMKVGVFFDGRLYNDTYITVKDASEEHLKQAIRFRNKSVGTEVLDKWYAESIDDFSVIVQPEITDSIAMNYIVTINPDLLESEELSMSFAMNGNTTSVITGVEVWDNAYKFTYPDIMAQNMADTITATLTVGREIKTYKYSVLDYCVDVMNTTTLKHESGAAYSDKQMAALRELVVDLVQYGAEVQKYKKPSIGDADLVTTKFANKVSNYTQYDKADTDLSALSGVVATKLTGDDTDSAYTWKSATLVLGNKVKIRCQFNAENTDNLTIKTSMGDEIVTFSETGTSGVYAFEIDNIYAYEYAKEITVQFYEGESAVGKTLHYSVNTYLSAKQNSDYKELLKAIHNYGDAAEAYVDSLELRVLITSDIHLTESITWQRMKSTTKQRAEKWLTHVNEEHEKEPFDLIVINGDISLDHTSGEYQEGAYYDDKDGESDDIVKQYFSQLPAGVPVVVIPGNHEQYGNEDWKAITGNDRQSYMVMNNSLFLFLDNYKVEETQTEPSNGTYTKTDVAYINKMMDKYPSCDVYLISHMFYTNQESAEFKKLVAENDSIKGLFQGHTHNAATIELGADWGNKTIAQTGTYAHYDSEPGGDRFWGFRELKITQDSAYSNFIQFQSTETDADKVTDYTRKFFISYAQTDGK